MPLVTITTSERYDPSSGSVDLSNPELPREYTVLFGRALPGAMIEHAVHLGLDPDTPETGVQVVFKSFGRFDVNTPDLWVVVQQTEEPPDESVRKLITAKHWWLITALIDRTYKVKWPNFNFAFDLFWGPGHGTLNIDGETIQW